MADIRIEVITDPKLLPGRCWMYDGDKDEDAVKVFSQIKPRPDVIYRLRGTYFAPVAPDQDEEIIRA
jgi:hypothetical protein